MHNSVITYLSCITGLGAAGAFSVAAVRNARVFRTERSEGAILMSIQSASRAMALGMILMAFTAALKAIGA